MSAEYIPIAIRFLTGCLLRNPQAADRESYLALPNGRIARADIYEPQGVLRGCIVVVPGMSPDGWRNRRLRILNRSFADAGFRTICPLIESISNLRIRATQIAEVNAVIRASITQWSAGIPLGVFAISFSGAITLLACATPPIAPPIAAVLALGTFSNPERMVHHLATSADPYGRLVGLANAHELASPDDHPIAQELYRLAIDTYYGRENQGTTHHTDVLSPTEIEYVRQLLVSPDACEAAWSKYRSHLVQALRQLTVDGATLRPIRGRITLLHGTNDPVVPCSETRALARSLNDIGRSPRVCLSPVLRHGTHVLPWHGLRHVPAVVQTFAGYFSDIACG